MMLVHSCTEVCAFWVSSKANQPSVRRRDAEQHCWVALAKYCLSFVLICRHKRALTASVMVDPEGQVHSERLTGV